MTHSLMRLTWHGKPQRLCSQLPVAGNGTIATDCNAKIQINTEVVFFPQQCHQFCAPAQSAVLNQSKLTVSNDLVRMSTHPPAYNTSDEINDLPHQNPGVSQTKVHHRKILRVQTLQKVFNSPMVQKILMIHCMGISGYCCSYYTFCEDGLHTCCLASHQGWRKPLSGKYNSQSFTTYLLFHALPCRGCSLLIWDQCQALKNSTSS